MYCPSLPLLGSKTTESLSMSLLWVMLDVERAHSPNFYWEVQSLKVKALRTSGDLENLGLPLFFKLIQKPAYPRSGCLIQADFTM
mmetsp:Transcript_27404/g.68759  ORF Transcript_27404/g.68759 Transcript_27404/m.68759 type:complete len:85 (-) Transcript_27404:1997-2251(-)